MIFTVLFVAVVLILIVIFRANPHPYGHAQRRNIAPPRYRSGLGYVDAGSQPSASTPDWERPSSPPFVRRQTQSTPRMSRASYAAQFAADAAQAQAEQGAIQAERLAMKMARAAAMFQERQHRHERLLSGIIIDGDSKRIE